MNKSTYASIYKDSTTKISFVMSFRLVFLLFSLYLLGDVFYRWDGFRLYASFSEFFPSVALASILWSILSFLVSVLIWISLKLFKWLCRRLGWKVGIEHLLFYVISFALFGAIAWKGKKIIWPAVQITTSFKLIILLCIAAISLLLTWTFRRRTGFLLSRINERITPLVWLFGFFVILSIPLVVFVNWGKSSDRPVEPDFQSFASIPDKERPNILLVTFDSLTAHNMSAYGYERDTTPYIKKWAESSTLFTRAKSASNLTGPTTSSLMTGKRVWTHRRFYQERATVSANYFKTATENLAMLLKEKGYFNIALAANAPARVENIGIAESFHVVPSFLDLVSPDSLEGIMEQRLYHVFGDHFVIYNWLGQEDFIFRRYLNLISKEINDTEHPPEKSFNKFLKIVDKYPYRPFFAWIHVFPPHEPYLPPEPYAGTYSSINKFREKNIQYSIRVDEYNIYARKYGSVPESIKDKLLIMRDYYDEYLLYLDSRFKEFIEKLKERNYLENTIIILSADHGESFDSEHDYFFHSDPHLYEQVVSIPLIIREPGQERGHVIKNLVEQIDIPATILDFAKIPIPAWMEGRSVLPLLRNNELPSKPVFSMHLVPNPRSTQHITKGTIAIWKGDYKLIRYLEEGKSLLYNLTKDPDELNNLYDKEEETGQRLLTILNENLKEANERIMMSGK